MDRVSQLTNKIGVDKAAGEIKSALRSAWERDGVTQVTANLGKQPLSLVWDPHGERLHFMTDSTIYLEDPTSGDGVEMPPITLGVADPPGVEKLLDERIAETGREGLRPYCERLVSAWKETDFAKCLVKELSEMFPQSAYREKTAEDVAKVLLYVQEWPQGELSGVGGTYLAREDYDDHISHTYGSQGAQEAQEGFSLDTYSLRDYEVIHQEASRKICSDGKSKYHHHDGAIKALNKAFDKAITLTIGTSLTPVSGTGDGAPSLIAGSRLKRLKSVYSVSKADLLA